MGARQNRPRNRSTMKKAQAAVEPFETNAKPEVIAVAGSGDWLTSEELKEVALKSVGEGKNVTLSLNGVEHLDASALQILLAWDAEQKRSGSQLCFMDVSPSLHQWFNHAGAAAHFSMNDRKSDE